MNNRPADRPRSQERAPQERPAQHHVATAGETAVVLKPGKEKSLRRRHPWVYATAVSRVTGNPASGATVAVRSAEGAWLAWAAYSPASSIRARVWSFAEQDVVDAGFLRQRVLAAVAARDELGASSNALRLVFGESDRLAAFDTVLLGRKTYEATRRHGGGAMPGMHAYVFSRTLRQEDCQGVTVSNDPMETLAALREAPGKDIWLFGGGELFRGMLELGLVDSVELAVIPVLPVGGGLPLLPHPAKHAKLRLTQHRVYPKTGTVSLEYVPA